MRLLKNQRGFTLIEMLIVMLIITVLIAIAIPNVTKQSSAVDEKCRLGIKLFNYRGSRPAFLRFCEIKNW